MTSGNLNNSQPCEDLVIFGSASFGWFPPGFELFPNTYSLIITYLKTQECSADVQSFPSVQLSPLWLFSTAV